VAQATFAECPKCGAKVRKEKLRRHIAGVHGENPKPTEPVDAGPVRPVSVVQFPWRALIALAVVAGVVTAGYWFVSQLPSGGGGTPTPGGKVAVIEVENFGTFKVLLDPVRAPKTAANFIKLANAGSYNDNSFHRVVANFVIQGGAVVGAANTPWEFTGLVNAKYAISMARSGDANNASYKDTATSQFFINLKDNPSLDPRSPSNPTGVTYSYVVFGKVVEGQAVVDAIGRVATGSDDAPLARVKITRVTITG